MWRSFELWVFNFSKKLFDYIHYLWVRKDRICSFSWKIQSANSSIFYTIHVVRLAWASLYIEPISQNNNLIKQATGNCWISREMVHCDEYRRFHPESMKAEFQKIMSSKCLFFSRSVPVGKKHVNTIIPKSGLKVHRVMEFEIF